MSLQSPVCHREWQPGRGQLSKLVPSFPYLVWSLSSPGTLYLPRICRYGWVQGSGERCQHLPKAALQGVNKAMGPPAGLRFIVEMCACLSL